MLPNFILHEATVILCGGDSQPSLFDPRQKHVSPYIDGARLFLPDGLPTEHGVPLVRAIALRR